MSPLAEKSALVRKAAILLGLLSFLSFLYFYEGGGWNQNSRFDLLRAIVERHTLQIDDYHQNTGDKAHFAGHYYSDKAPGLVFLAVPFALASRGALRIVGVDPDSAHGEIAVSYFASAGAVALPAALAAVCFFFLGLRFTGDLGGAAFGALVMCLGTPLWAYAGLFWAHALVGACLLFAFASALSLRESQSAREDWCWALAVGLAAGWATVTEYPAAPASAMVALLALSQAWQRGSAARWRVVAGVGFGATLCLVVLLGYLYAAFGTFRPSYSYYDPNSFSFMRQQGYMGLTYPHPDRLLKIMFGCARGLFFASPVLAAAAVGLWWLWRRTAHRARSHNGRGHRVVLLSVQRVVLLVESGARVRAAIRGSEHSVLMRWVGCGMGTGNACVAPRAGRACSVQRDDRAHGDLHDFAAGHAGQLPDRALGVARILGGANGTQPRIDVNCCRSRNERPLWGVQRWPVDGIAGARQFSSAAGDVGTGGVALVADDAVKRRLEVRVRYCLRHSC